MENPRANKLLGPEYSEEKLSLTINDLVNELRAIFNPYTMQGRKSAREVLRSAFQIEAEEGTAYRTNQEAIGTLQPRLEGALALLRALRAKRPPSVF